MYPILQRKLGGSIAFGLCTEMESAVGTEKETLRVDTGQGNTRPAKTLVQDNLQQPLLEHLSCLSAPTCGAGSTVFLCGKLIWKTEGKGESCHEPWHCWQRDGCQRCFSQAPRAGWCHHSQFPPAIPGGVGAAPLPALSGGSGSKAEPPCTGSCSSSPPRCSQGLRWGQRALSLPAWHSSQDSRGTGSSRCAWKHRHRHTPGPGMSTGPRACRALPQPLCPARAQAGWGGCARLGQLRVPTAPVPLLAPRGTPSTHLSRSSRRPSPGLASGPARGCPAPP